MDNKTYKCNNFGLTIYSRFKVIESSESGYNMWPHKVQKIRGHFLEDQKIHFTFYNEKAVFTAKELKNAFHPEIVLHNYIYSREI